MKIAIIGTGIAGLGAAYALSGRHDVELFEAIGYAGGHANTVTLNRTDEIDESAVCEAGFAIRSLRDMQIVLTHPANDSLPEFPAVRPTF